MNEAPVVVNTKMLRFEDFLRIGREEGYTPNALAFLWSGPERQQWGLPGADKPLTVQEDLLRETLRWFKGELRGTSSAAWWFRAEGAAPSS